jgi:hypothetical protein
MGLYTGDKTNFPANIYQFEETDVVQGGPTGIDNVPLQNLADRTAWLQDQLGIITRLTNEIVYTANQTIVSSLVGNLITALSPAYTTLTLSLDNVANFRLGTVIPFTAACNSYSVIKIAAFTGQTISNIGTATPIIYLHDGEQLMLMALGNHWKVVYCSDSINKVGEEVKSRTILHGTLPMYGQVFNRVTYPRLWNFIVSNPALYVSDSTWNSSTNYQSYFSVGDNVSTFRMPHEGGLFERILDYGRGIDPGRSLAGSYQDMLVQNHTHILPVDGGGNLDLQTLTNTPNSDEGYNSGMYTGGYGGAETRPRNVAKYNLIKY